YWPFDRSLEVADFKQTEGKGIEAWVDEHYLKMGSASFLAVEEDDQAGGSAIYVREDGRYLGCCHIEQSYREGLDQVFRSLEKQYDLSVISGDRDTERPFLQRLLGEGRDLFFQFSPVQKLDYVRQLQAKDEKVMMIGDGLNDAGALQQSEVGIAVTENKNNFTPACDGILDGASFQKIAAIIDFVKDGRKVILLIFVYSFLYNVIGGYFALKGVLEPVIAAILMPASSLSIILLSYCLTEFSALRHKLNTDDENHPVE
ncbi:MAG TPA: HAD-IC family P-type ATPase, partial [Saprospiraceae bacterium]|nr:HAD-IC family P-type ATPase [Saprospiraceae bacterium]